MNITYRHYLICNEEYTFTNIIQNYLHVIFFYKRKMSKTITHSQFDLENIKKNDKRFVSDKELTACS